MCLCVVVVVRQVLGENPMTRVTAAVHEQPSPGLPLTFWNIMSVFENFIPSSISLCARVCIKLPVFTTTFSDVLDQVST